MIVTAVLVTPVVAEELGPILHRAMSESVRRDGRSFSSEAWDIATSIDRLGQAQRQRREAVVSDVVVTTVETLSPARVDPVNETTVTDAASRLGCSRQAILSRLRRGTMAGRRDDRGRWWIPSDNLEVP